MSRLTFCSGGAGWARLVLAGLAWLLAPSAGPAAAADVAAGFRADVVVSRIPRPTQLALDAQGRLVVLSSGWRGDAAAEIYRLDLRGPLPVDASRVPRIVIPFAEEPRKSALGSLAVDPRSGDLLLGEENGNRIYRLGPGHRLQAAVVGLNHLLGGSTLAVDRQGRLIFVDYESPESHLRSETPLPPSLSWLTEEGYRGPLVFRVDPREEHALPRRADLLVPIIPRRGLLRSEREPLWRLVGMAVLPDGALVFLNAIGAVFRLGPDDELYLVARLPAGQYHRTSLAAGADGSIFVCGGFHIRQIFRISAAGEVSTVARDLGDPAGIVVDSSGTLYVAEAALHRILRISPMP